MKLELLKKKISNSSLPPHVNRCSSSLAAVSTASSTLSYSRPSSSLLLCAPPVSPTSFNYGSLELSVTGRDRLCIQCSPNNSPSPLRLLGADWC